MINLVVGHRHGSSSNASCRDRESRIIMILRLAATRSEAASLSDPAARIFEKASEPGNGSTRCRAAAWPWRTKAHGPYGTGVSAERVRRPGGCGQPANAMGMITVGSVAPEFTVTL